MSETTLLQSVADDLLAMEKHRASDEVYKLPVTGGSVIIPLQSFDEREQFILDVSKNRIDFGKGKYQNRARHTAILARLDFGGAPHQNPDGE